jgi:hypothetical protein
VDGKTAESVLAWFSRLPLRSLPLGIILLLRT